MNKGLFIHRVQLPQRQRQEVSNDHTPIPGMNLFGQSPGASVMAERTAVDERQDLIASLDDLAQRASTFEGLLGDPTISQQQESSTVNTKQFDERDPEQGAELNAAGQLVIPLMEKDPRFASVAVEDFLSRTWWPPEDLYDYEFDSEQGQTVFKLTPEEKAAVAVLRDASWQDRSEMLAKFGSRDYSEVIEASAAESEVGDSLADHEALLEEEEQLRQAYLQTPEGLREWAIEARYEARNEARLMVSEGWAEEDDAEREEQRAVVSIVKRIGERLPGSVSEGSIPLADAEQRYQEALSKIPEHEDQRLQDARARFDQAFDRIAELRDLNLVQPSMTNDQLMKQSNIELPGGASVSIIDFKEPIEPKIEQALAHQASNVDFDHATDETTPLHSAVGENKLGLVQRLLDHGADPNFEVSEFAANADAPLVPLMRAQSPEMVELLCQHGADVQQCLWHEDMLSNPEVTQAFLDRGLNPNARTQAQYMDADELAPGESALHLAQDPEVARRLVLAGGDVQANAGTREKPLSVTQKWAEDPESFGLIPVSKGPEFEQAVQSASVERQHLQQQHQENTVEKNMKPDEQMHRVPPTLSAALAHGMAMPKRHATLGEAAAEATGQGKSEGEGQGGRQGGQERPSHSSYYNPVPVGGIAMPKRGSDIGDAVVQREAAQRKRHSQSI